MQSPNVFANPSFNRESLEAFLRAKGFKLRTATVLGLFYENPHGLTQDDAAAALGLLTQTCSPIFTDLFKNGLIERKRIAGTEDYETRPTRSSSSAGVAILSPDWAKAASAYRIRKRMARETEKAVKNALTENFELRGIVASLIEIIEVQVPFKDADLEEALTVIRRDYSL